MSRVVIDTNVFIRYLLKPNPIIRYLIEEMWLNDELVLVTSPELIAELNDVLARDYIQTLAPLEVSEFLVDAIQFRAEMLPSLGELPTYTRDPKDDKFVACVVAGRASFIITLDKDILELERVNEILIVTPHQFVKQL